MYVVLVFFLQYGWQKSKEIYTNIHSGKIETFHSDLTGKVLWQLGRVRPMDIISVTLPNTVLIILVHFFWCLFIYLLFIMLRQHEHKLLSTRTNTSNNRRKQEHSQTNTDTTWKYHGVCTPRGTSMLI